MPIKEKLLCDAHYDKMLMAQRLETEKRLRKYNQLEPDDLKEKNKLISQMLGKTGHIFSIRQPFYCDYGYNIEIGENFYANLNLTILDEARVTIGDNVFIAPNVGIYTAGHPENIKKRIDGIEHSLPVNIGDNVWIGASAVILAGVNIGNNSIIGAGSVVTKDIPEGVLAAGNPCKVIRKLKEEDRE